MPTVLLAWELGGGLGHFMNLRPLAEGLRRRGHRVVAALRDLSVARRFLADAPTSAAEAATIILEGVKADRWRILVGSDAQLMDRMVRDDPEQAYEEPFFARFAAAAGWHPGR